MRSRAAAVGVGFLLNSTSSVTNWSWVARCLFWFFCCWVNVLLRGGLRAAEEVDVAGVVDKEAAGEGVDISGDSALPSSFTMQSIISGCIFQNSWLIPNTSVSMIFFSSLA